MPDLLGKVILVTGAAGAIGGACARRFADAGARLVLTDRVQPADRRSGRFVVADVTGRSAMQALVADILQAEGRLDGAVLAAGIEGPVGPVEDLDEAAFDQVMAVNVKGVLFALQACLAAMAPARSGSIVALSSISGMVGTPQLSAYTMSKHAVIGLVRAAALESGPRGVRINAICPGPVDSAMMRRLDDAFAAREPGRVAAGGNASRSIPLQRYVTAEEVAGMAAFLCSDAASSCHGGAYALDGGFTAK